jgi:NRPS condensation-like uncharacterized protein
MKKKRYWFKIDNAGKVFPSISSIERSNTFRLSASLYQPVDPKILEQAVNMMLPRFESFAIQMKNGIFWQYFSENHKTFKVEKEPATIAKYAHPKKRQGFLFQVYYFDTRITLETFHALTDGTGALQFLQSIVYQYLILLGHDIETEGLILGTTSPKSKENEDSFIANYDKNAVKQPKEIQAFHLSGEKFDDQFSLLFSINMKLDALKTVIKSRFQATITQYFSSIVIYAIMRENAAFYIQKKPLKLFIPINLRPYFDSITLRNFSLYLKNVFDPSDYQMTFEEVIEKVKEQFKPQLTKEALSSRISQYVTLEKHIILRIMPFFLKQFAFKIGYDILGSKVNTASFSNLGVVTLPKDMIPHVSSMNFIIGGFGLGMSALTYNNQTIFNFTTRFKDTTVMKVMTELLHLHGIDFFVVSNYYDTYQTLL